ncbi:MAG: hypothetical protein ABW194_03480 [Novosphingobium sp.]
MSSARKPARHPAHDRVRRAVLAGLAGLAGLALAQPALAQAVVVRSTGPSMATYPQGKRLPANAKVTLKTGDKVTVLDKAGTRVLSGPGSFTLDSTVARDQTAVSRVSGVLAGGAGARPRTGAVRGVPRPMAAPPPAPDSVWYIDVSRGGAYCIAGSAPPVLWRPNRAEQAMGKLSDSRGKTVDVTWKAGNPLKQWPAQLPLVDGASYRFSDPVGPTVTIVTHLIAPAAADDLAVAGMLADKGCNAQLDVFANTAGDAAAAGVR